MENARTVLVPIDFREASLAAFEAALTLHATPGTTVVAQYVIDEGVLDAVVELGYAMRGEVESKARTHAERAMRRLTDVEVPEGVEIERVVSVGKPVMEILRLATELVADLVIMGTPPPGDSPETALFGSIAEHVLRAARCPVLVIPGPAGDAPIAEPPHDVASGAPSTT